MDKTLFYIGGTKGGVGKSFVSMALIDFLITRYGKEQVLLIETDYTNPDVARIYSEKVSTETIALDDDETSWMTLARTVYANQDKLMVLNSAKGNSGIRQFGKMFQSSLEDSFINLVTFWPMNRQLDSVEHLLEYIKIVSYGEIFPIRNNYYGSPSDFIIFDDKLTNSKDKDIFLSRFPRDNVLDFPSLNDLFTLKIYSERIAIENMSEHLIFFERALFNSWREVVSNMFESTGLFEFGMNDSDEGK